MDIAWRFRKHILNRIYVLLHFLQQYPLLVNLVCLSWIIKDKNMAENLNQLLQSYRLVLYLVPVVTWEALTESYLYHGLLSFSKE